MEISIRLDAFEGPLDLLLQLIEKNKIDIYDIPIVEITDQYMEVLHAMEAEDLGLMSEFLVMAATLLDIKCRMLLPREVNEEGEEEDPRQDLVQQLLEYKMYKYMSFELRDRMEDAQETFFRRESLPKEVKTYKEPVSPENLLAGLDLIKLRAIYDEILRRQVERVDPIRSRFGKIEKEPVSVSDKLLQIRDYAAKNRRFSFRSLLLTSPDRFSVVVTFLSVLELMKMGHIRASQEELFGDIGIEVVDDPKEWKNLTEYAEEG